MRRIEFTQEMIGDLYRMGDVDFAKKWGVHRVLPMRYRKLHDIKSFLPQHGTKRKIIDGVENKWCSRGGGHWTPLENFRVVPTRAGGYAGICKEHEREDKRTYYHKSGGLDWQRAWIKTDKGRASLRNTWRKEKAKKDNAYVQWDRKDEDRAYRVFGGRCAYCGIEVEFLKIEFDHFVPIASGGKTEPKNMVPCCKKCNHGSGGKFKKDAWEWLTAKFGIERANWIFNNIRQKLNID